MIHATDHLLPGPILAVMRRDQPTPRPYVTLIRVFREDGRFIGWQRDRVYSFPDEVVCERKYGRVPW